MRIHPVGMCTYAHWIDVARFMNVCVGKYLVPFRRLPVTLMSSFRA